MKIGLGLLMSRRRGGGGGSPPAFNPADLFGVGDLGGFWDLSESSSLFQTTDTSTPVTAAGQNLSRVNDLSGNNNHLLLTTGQPLYQEDGAVSYMSLDGVDDAMATGSITGIIRRNSTFAVAMYYASGGASAVYQSVFGAFLNTTNYALLAIRSGISAPRIDTRGAAVGVGALNSPTGASGSIPADTYLTFTGRFREAEQTLLVDGVGLTPVSHTWADGQTVSSTISTGVSNFGVARRIITAFWISRDLSTEELDNLHAWMAAKLNP